MLHFTRALCNQAACVFQFSRGIHCIVRRLTVINASYATAEARVKILELIAWSCNALSSGVHPSEDPWGQKFSKCYEKARCAKAEGISADQDYLRILFALSRGATHQAVCHYCNMSQWVYENQPIDAVNDLNSLFTCFGPPEEQQRIWTAQEWVELYGKTPLCTILGFDPSRFSAMCCKDGSHCFNKRYIAKARDLPRLYAHRPPWGCPGLHRERFARHLRSARASGVQLGAAVVVVPKLVRGGQRLEFHPFDFFDPRNP